MDYQNYYNAFRELILIADKISGTGLISDFESRQKWALDLFFQLRNRSKTILSLLPEDGAIESKTYDLSAIACLTRSLGEIYEAFYYFGIDRIEEPEAMLRFLLMKIHQESELEEIQKKFRYEEFDIKLIKESIRSLRDEAKRRYSELSSLEGYEIYDLINQGKDKFRKTLKHNKGRCLDRKTINRRIFERIHENQEIPGVGKIDLDKLEKIFEAMDTYLSNHIHVSPLAVSESAYEVMIGDKSKHFYKLLIRHNSFFLGSAIFDIAEMQNNPRISDNSKELVAESVIGYLRDLLS
ncbi:hypothetical protein H6G89_29705 [Oscillatoria sp. FACHB-1407]|nr:hypothetical protein [Oscillatoria sp. FACHB-1407]MBD2465188.1 hypothetical protein [Oscillatoria sp. FACHB-1407]